MKFLALFTFLIAAGGLGLSVANFKSASADTTKQTVASLQTDVQRLKGQLDAQIAENDQLNAKITALESAPKATVSDDKIRDLARQEMQEQMAQFRQRGQQNGGNGGQQQQQPRPDERTVLKEQVGIEGEKAETVVKAVEGLRDNIRSIWRDNKGGSRDANTELMNTEIAKIETELATVLSADEMTKFKAVREQFLDRGRGRRGGGNNQQNQQNNQPQPAQPQPAAATPAQNF